MAKHLKVKDLIKELQKCDPEAKIIIHNTDVYIPGMYYVTDITDWDPEKYFVSDGEHQIELHSNHKSIAKGWKD